MEKMKKRRGGRKINDENVQSVWIIQTDREVKHGNSREPCSLVVTVLFGKNLGTVASTWQTAKQMKLHK